MSQQLWRNPSPIDSKTTLCARTKLSGTPANDRCHYDPQLDWVGEKDLGYLSDEPNDYKSLTFSNAVL